MSNSGTNKPSKHKEKKHLPAEKHNATVMDNMPSPIDNDQTPQKETGEETKNQRDQVDSTEAKHDVNPPSESTMPLASPAKGNSEVTTWGTTSPIKGEQTAKDPTTLPTSQLRS